VRSPAALIAQTALPHWAKKPFEGFSQLEPFIRVELQVQEAR